MKLYHATTQENVSKIIKDWAIKPQGFDKCIFLADNKTSAAMFLAIRGEKEIVVFEVDASKLDNSKLERSFDHNEKFFRCKAYMYTDKISLDDVDELYEYHL